MACGEVFRKVFYHGYKRAGNSYEKQVAELHPGIFQEGWLACLRELETPFDHPAWTAPTLALPIELPNPLVAYSLILLPGFNEEEYATLPAGEEDGNVVVAQGDKLAEVERVASE